MTTFKGKLVDIHRKEIYPASVKVKDGIIEEVIRISSAPPFFIMPGFIDAHIHIESSMLVPREFARIALRFGTVATVSDPHEIANVLGIEGVEYMLDNARSAGLKFHFGAPSCVPATSFETSGATVDAAQVKRLLDRGDIYYLAEMMNYPGVLHDDPEVMQKILSAQQAGKPVDGHAPGLRGGDAAKYIAAGISTDHECVDIDEAKEKLSYGMKIIIREGSAARNFESLHPLIASYPSEVMFCSDDKHPDDLLKGHIDELVRQALAKGYDLWDVLRIACLNPILHYQLPVGLIRPGDPADFIIVEDLKDFHVRKVLIDGKVMVESGKVLVESKLYKRANHFRVRPKGPRDFALHDATDPVPVIRVHDGQLVTSKEWIPVGDIPSVFEGLTQKIAVVNRYEDRPPAIGLIRGFDLFKGAIASSVAHDSHNIVVVGTSDELICRAVNLVISQGGGLAAVGNDFEKVLPLPIAGIISASTGEEVAEIYENLNHLASSMGCQLKAPFMTLSFMALLVIPAIKMSDLGVFDAEAFKFY